MEKIGLFYGSSTGNSKDAAEIIKKEFGDDIGDIYDICGKGNEDLQKYNNLDRDNDSRLPKKVNKILVISPKHQQKFIKSLQKRKINQGTVKKPH